MPAQSVETGMEWILCMCVHHKDDHKDLPQKRPIPGGDGRAPNGRAPKKSHLTVNEDLKVAMMTASTEADVQALH